MADEELEKIRARRMAELQQQMGVNEPIIQSKTFSILCKSIIEIIVSEKDVCYRPRT